MVAGIIADRIVPEEVRWGEVRLKWERPENRPYLRLQARGMVLSQEGGKIESALDEAMILLALDPGDSQGIRGEAVGMALELKDPKTALEILEPFGEDDFLVESSYGGALALFMLGEEAAATEALDGAIAGSPRVARRILNPDLPEPTPGPFGVIVGGEEEAFLYSRKWGFLWTRDPRVMEWLKQRYHRYESGKH